jgi:peptidoglycan L-alanyl-D-glutamate endopeptidase CwlK
MKDIIITDINEQRILTLVPSLHRPAFQLVFGIEEELQRERGDKWRVMVTQAFRTAKMQAELYAQGRTKPGRIVTYAAGTSSRHCVGRAVDVVLMHDGAAVWEDAFYQIAGEIGEALGWQWGGRWKKLGDVYHFER